MKTLTAPMIKGSIVSAILLFALGVLPGACAESAHALAAPIKAPAAYPKCPGSGPLPRNTPYCLHRALPGQTLSTLAKQYGTTPDAIRQANQEPRAPGHKRLTRRNALRAGDYLRIPLPSVAPSSPMPEDTSVSLPGTPVEATVTPPVSAGPSLSATAKAPPLSTDENIAHALAAVQNEQQALQAALHQQGTQIEGFLQREQQHGKQLKQQRKDITDSVG